MRRILDHAGRRVLADLAGRRTALCFDFDGTLAPIVRDFHEVRLRQRTRDLLAAVVARWPCALLSGRARADAARLVDGIRFRAIVGNHGAEPGADGTNGAGHADRARVARVVARWRRLLDDRVGRRPGVEIEDKRISLSIHYRRAPHPGAAARAIRAAAATLHGARLVGGKRVVNVVPEGAPHKGTAFLSLIRRLRCETGLIVGDDVTDEDAFLAARTRPGLVSVRVGHSDRSAADWFLKDQAEIDDLLAILAALRT
jgi:trehalose 6-phosphate phosphatase